ncbi:ECF transporter S component [Desulforudis sp. DRI-14]|uniref:ECF transporter S component n=1 Tax=Desulforudis sp. DRI-14 TaxID=3459793 RepID=UPI0034890981
MARKTGRSLRLLSWLVWLLPLAVLGACAWLGVTGTVVSHGLLAFGAAVLVLVVAAWRYECGRPAGREIMLVASLAALAAAGRIPFAFLPGVQPVTFVCITAGIVFGARVAFAVGAVAAVLSNFALGQGPWTPWQMIAWGLAGASAGWCSVLIKGLGLPAMVAFSILWGYLYGAVVNLWVWTTSFYPLDLRSFLAVESLSLPFDTAHAIGNAVFVLLLGRRVIRTLERFRDRITVTRLSSQTRPRPRPENCLGPGSVASRPE